MLVANAFQVLDSDEQVQAGKNNIEQEVKQEDDAEKLAPAQHDQPMVPIDTIQKRVADPPDVETTVLID